MKQSFSTIYVELKFKLGYKPRLKTSGRRPPLMYDCVHRIVHTHPIVPNQNKNKSNSRRITTRRSSYEGSGVVCVRTRTGGRVGSPTSRGGEPATRQSIGDSRAKWTCFFRSCIFGRRLLLSSSSSNYFVHLCLFCSFVGRAKLCEEGWSRE